MEKFEKKTLHDVFPLFPVDPPLPAVEGAFFSLRSRYEELRDFFLPMRYNRKRP